MTGPCLSTADPCASFAAPLCLDDSDCDSAAVLLNPGGYWACAAHATTRPGPWRLVGPVACESGGEWMCLPWQLSGEIRALLDRYETKIIVPLPRGTDDPPSGWLRRG